MFACNLLFAGQSVFFLGVTPSALTPSVWCGLLTLVHTRIVAPSLTVYHHRNGRSQNGSGQNTSKWAGEITRSDNFSRWGGPTVCLLQGLSSYLYVVVTTTSLRSSLRDEGLVFWLMSSENFNPSWRGELGGGSMWQSLFMLQKIWKQAVRLETGAHT